MTDRHQQKPYPLRMDASVRSALEKGAKDAGRSLHAEILARLQQSFEGSPGPDLPMGVDEYAKKHKITIADALSALVAAGLNSGPVYFMSVQPGASASDMGRAIRVLVDVAPDDAAVVLERRDRKAAGR